MTRFGAEIKNLLSADIALDKFKGKLAIGDAGFELGAERKENFSFRLALREAANDRRHQLLEQTRHFFRSADSFVRNSGQPGGLVVILDNLEKLALDNEVQASAQTMFHAHAEAVRAPLVHLIYTVPPRLVFSRSGPELGKIYDGEPLVLPMVKVRDRDSGQHHDLGLRAMHSVLARRLDMDEVFAAPSVAETLVRCCGGYTRDLLRLAQYSLAVPPKLPLADQHVRIAVAKLKRSYTRGFRTDDRPLLEYIRSRRPEIIPAEWRDQLEDVIVWQYAMVYGNERDWYDLHPLLDDLVDRAEGGEPESGR